MLGLACTCVASWLALNTATDVSGTECLCMRLIMRHSSGRCWVAMCIPAHSFASAHVVLLLLRLSRAWHGNHTLLALPGVGF